MSKEVTHRPPRTPRARRDLRAAVPAAVHCFLQRDNGVHAVPLEQALAEYAALAAERSGPPRLWIDVICPGDEEEDLLRHKLGLHPLAVEDCMRGRQRPKLDFYPGYFFLVGYIAYINDERSRTALPCTRGAPSGALALSSTAGAWHTAPTGLPAAYSDSISTMEWRSSTRSQSGPWPPG